MVVLVSGVAKVLDSKAIVSRPPEPTAVENGNDKMEGIPPLKSAGGGERTSNNNTASITLGQDDRIMKIHAPCIIRATVQDKGFFTVEFSNDARLMTEETCFYIHTEKGSAMLGMVDQKGAAVSTSPERSPINLQTVMEEFEDDEDLEVLPGEFATDGGFSLAAPVLLSPKALPAPLDLLGAPSNNTPEENKNFFPEEPDTPAAGAIAVPTNMFGSRAAVHRFFAAAGGSGSPRRGSGLLLQKGYSFGKTGSKNHRKGFGGGGSSTPGGVAPAPSPCHKIEEEERPEVDEDEEEHPLEAHV
uniref:Uncharacterized protein n=1 Tax=Heterosigma akashiwo TaxID=2829 RepID=A0A7S3UXH6_HETAK